MLQNVADNVDHRTNSDHIKDKSQDKKLMQFSSTTEETANDDLSKTDFEKDSDPKVRA